MIRHHPDDALLLAHAAGQLPTGASLVVESHLEACDECCDRLHELQTLGGALLDEIEPVALQPDALARALAAIDGTPATVPRQVPPPRRVRPELPTGASWPRALDGCTISPWRWMGPGMHWSRVSVPHDRAANLFLLRIGAGRALPFHTHSEQELTQVLYGEFKDDRASYARGDFDGADGEIHHKPRVKADGQCICLISVQGRVLFKGAMARTLGALVGI